MALIPSSDPQDWYNINNNEALAIQTKLINDWEPQREVWPLKYGHFITGFVNVISGLSINSLFRRTMKLQHHGRGITIFLIALGPTATGYIFHHYFITRNLLLYEDTCSMCYQIKALSSMCVSNFLYPMIASPLVNLTIAARLGYRVPYVYEIKEVTKFIWTVVKPHSRILLLLFLGNIIVTTSVTSAEVKTMESLTNILLKIRKYIDDNEIRLIPE